MIASERQERFQALLEEHKKILYKVCNAYGRTREDREDLAQEIVIHLWQAFGGFDARCRFSTWMYRIALNVAISYVRREVRRIRPLLAADARLLEEIEEPGGPAEEILLLYQFIEKQDPLHKALLLLYLDGYTYLEIGSVLGITETNVATKISRLKKTMQQELA